MTRTFTLILMAVLTLLSVPEAHAGRRHDGHRCRKDAQCLSATCCNGRCSPQSTSCDEWPGLVAAAGRAKPPPVEKCRNGAFCGACGVCIKGRCAGGETGRCSACKTCSQDGSACVAVPDGSGVAGEYYGCGPDAHGGLWCCGGRCSDTSSDIDNCGACGNACTGGESCQYTSGGGVGCRCRDSETECTGTCADLQTDPNNCGQCGHVCASGACENGTCSCLSHCDGSGNCGGGQADCGACETCTDGACMPTCNGGRTCCDAAGCVDTQNDPNNCGSCGNACTGGATCQNGACTASSCPNPWFSCGVSYPPHVSDVCCLPGSQCCIGGRNTSCYSEGTCCVTSIGDAFICGPGSHCCPNSINVPCLPDGAACPPS